MHHRHRLSPSRTLFAILVLSWGLSLPAAAHDPLGHHHAASSSVDHGNHDVTLTREDLSRLRDLVSEFRKTGDDRHLDRAWARIAPALDEQTAAAETLVTAAFVAQSRHQFTLALSLVDRALAVSPSHDEAQLLAASIHLVLGDAPGAGRACRALRDVAPLIVIACQARVSLVAGRSLDAYERLVRVLHLVDDGRHSNDVRAWVHGVAGDLAVSLDRRHAAREHYERSLALTESTQVRAALVDVLLADGLTNAARQVLDDGAPALPLLVRRLVVAKRLDRLDEFGTEFDSVQSQFARWIDARDWLHAREMARFYLDVADRPALARRLALINLRGQREPEDLLLEVRTRG